MTTLEQIGVPLIIFGMVGLVYGIAIARPAGHHTEVALPTSRWKSAPQENFPDQPGQGEQKGTPIMSTIKDTALGAIGGRVPRGMGAKAQTALDALVEREQVMSDNIIEAGVALGATRDQVAAILADAGMHLSPAQDEAGVTEANHDDVLAAVQALDAKVDKAIAKGKEHVAHLRDRGYLPRATRPRRRR